MSAPDALWPALEAGLVARADAPLFTFLGKNLEPTVYTGTSLRERVLATAEKMRALSLGPGPLGILCSTQEAQVLHFLGALAAGLAPAILTPPNRKLKMGYYLEMLKGVAARCQFAAIVCDAPLPGVEATLLEPLTLLPTHQVDARGGVRVSGASFVQFSSGTTGIKKGVLVSDQAVLAQAAIYGDAIGMTPNDVVVSWLPLYHDMGFIACFVMPLLRGTPCVMLDPLEWVARPSTYLEAVTRHGGTLSWHPNFAFAFMAERVVGDAIDGLDLRTLRHLFNCSEPATHESQRRFLERFASCGLRSDAFAGCYAMAETTFALTHGRSTDDGYFDPAGPDDAPRAKHENPAVSVGRALPGVRIDIVDPSGRRLQDRQLGEIWVRSPFNLHGYFNNAEATALALEQGFYKTGDLGYRVGSEVFVCGRKKEVLIVGGVNVWPQDLESLAWDVPGVRAGRAVAFAVFDDVRQTDKVVLLVETELALEAQRKVLLEIRQRILATMQLSNFEVHAVESGWLQKSSSGKSSREQNRMRWLARAPATPMSSPR